MTRRAERGFFATPGLYGRPGRAGVISPYLGGFRRGLAARGDPVAVLLAEASRCVLRQRVAVPLAVGRAHERRDHLEVPFADVGRLPPEVGEPEVDVELEQIDS